MACFIVVADDGQGHCFEQWLSNVWHQVPLQKKRFIELPNNRFKNGSKGLNSNVFVVDKCSHSAEFKHSIQWFFYFFIVPLEEACAPQFESHGFKSFRWMRTNIENRLLSTKKRPATFFLLLPVDGCTFFPPRGGWLCVSACVHVCVGTDVQSILFILSRVFMIQIYFLQRLFTWHPGGRRVASTWDQTFLSLITCKKTKTKTNRVNTYVYIHAFCI